MEPLCIISNDQDGNDCTALEPYVESSQSKSGSNSSRKSSKESLPYRYVEETSPNTSDTASSVVSYPSVLSRAPSELSIETNNTESRAHSTISAGDNISSVSSVPSRGTSSYGRARGLFRRGQVRNTRGGRGGIRGGRSIDRPISPRAESAAVKYTGPSYEELMSVTEYIEKFQLEKNYPHKRLEIKPEQIFRIGSKIIPRDS